MTVTLLSQLAKKGRFPPMTLTIKPLEGGPDIALDSFTNYSFSSNILIPVDSFSFGFTPPFTKKNSKRTATISDFAKEGDIVVMSFNDVQVATGIVCPIEMGTDDMGDHAQIHARDLMSQLEDTHAVTVEQDPIFGGWMTIDECVQMLVKGTRIQPGFINNNVPERQMLLATEPGESKLAVLQRFLTPLNCVAWMSGSGRLVIGKPAFNAPTSGELYCIRSERRSNVRSIRCIRNSVQIPNRVIGLWATAAMVPGAFKKQAVRNASPGPKRLFDHGNVVDHMIPVSLPFPDTPQGKADLARFGGDAGYVGSFVKQEIARQNVNALLVQVVMPGHYDENGQPFLADTTWKVTYERGNIDETMYCYGVDYQLSEETGQQTVLSLCQLGTIVPDAGVP